MQVSEDSIEAISFHVPNGIWKLISFIKTCKKQFVIVFEQTKYKKFEKIVKTC